MIVTNWAKKPKNAFHSMGKLRVYVNEEGVLPITLFLTREADEKAMKVKLNLSEVQSLLAAIEDALNVTVI